MYIQTETFEAPKKKSASSINRLIRKGPTLGSKHTLRTLPSCLRKDETSRPSISTSRSSKSSDATATHLSVGLKATSRTAEVHRTKKSSKLNSGTPPSPHVTLLYSTLPDSMPIANAICPCARARQVGIPSTAVSSTASWVLGFVASVPVRGSITCE